MLRRTCQHSRHPSTFECCLALLMLSLCRLALLVPELFLRLLLHEECLLGSLAVALLAWVQRCAYFSVLGKRGSGGL